MLVSQVLTGFIENKKWGYKLGPQVIIAAEYDTVFRFDKTNQIALVGNKRKTDKLFNAFTGAEEYIYDYYYINPKNEKLFIKAEDIKDSVFTFPNQKSLQFAYYDSTNYFKILFQSKLYLIAKDGRQLSPGCDNIREMNVKGYFEVEKRSNFEKRDVSMKGLIDSTGFPIVKCNYHTININNEDTTIYCCSAIYDSKLNDHVFNYNGKLIYSSQNHIVFSSKTLHIARSYSPREEFIIDNELTGEKYYLQGEKIIYIAKNKVLLVKNDSWYLFNLLTRKKKKVDKNTHLSNLLLIIG